MMPPTSSSPSLERSFSFCKTDGYFLGRLLRSLLGVLLLINGHSFAQAQAEEPKLGLSIDCVPGKDCHILAYVDDLPGPEFRDVGGGRQTYDGHDGTDFGLADEAMMKRGVAVKAAAAGTVARVRDGVADQRIQNSQAAQAVNAIGCGNGVVIDHPHQWRTIYCHLRQGSLTVKAGMQVAKGATLGMVGVSGLTSYPHVHFGLHHLGRTVDPFTGSPSDQTVQESLRPLWETPLAYTGVGLISCGFSHQMPKINAVWQGDASAQVLTTESLSILFWVHPFGVLAGDVEHFFLVDPNGLTVVEKRNVIAHANRINWLNSVASHSSPGAPHSAGIWQGRYQLLRSDRLLLDINRQIEVKAL